MKEKLELVRKLQKKYPDLYLGGSLGLFIHGISLGRYIGDIDFTKVSEEDLNPEHLKAPTEKNSTDMIYQFEEDGIKVEIGIDPHVGYEEHAFNGHIYKLSSINHTLGIKMKYALQGEEKHIKDIEYLLNLGKERNKLVNEDNYNDDLPF